MARKFEDATNERLVEVMLSGGPRISGDAFSELLARLQGGQEVVSLLPAPEGLEWVSRRRVLKLQRCALIRQRDRDSLLALLSRKTDDAIDCRSAAPHPDQQVRKNAASSLYYAFDMQGNVDVVRATIACLRAVRTTASGEAAQHLDSALRAQNTR